MARKKTYCDCQAGTCKGSFPDRRCAFKNVPDARLEKIKREIEAMDCFGEGEIRRTAIRDVLAVFKK